MIMLTFGQLDKSGHWRVTCWQSSGHLNGGKLILLGQFSVGHVISGNLISEQRFWSLTMLLHRLSGSVKFGHDGAWQVKLGKLAVGQLICGQLGLALHSLLPIVKLNRFMINENLLQNVLTCKISDRFIRRDKIIADFNNSLKPNI